jgi:ribosomal protein L11 methyltransferase
MCLVAIERVLTPGDAVLDLGCGSGILSIAAAKLGARSVFALEIDSVSVGVAKQNVRDNGEMLNIRVAQGTLPHPEVRARSYDIAIANISAKVVSELAGELVTAVRPGGEVIASGIVLEHKDRVVRELAEAGAAVGEPIVDGQWVTLVASVG